MYPKLTEHQWKWLESKKTKTKKTIKERCQSFLGSIVLPAFIGFFIIAYSPGDFFPPETKLQNLAFFLLIIYFVLGILAAMLIWIGVFTVSSDARLVDDDTAFKTVSKFSGWMVRKNTWRRRFSNQKGHLIALTFVVTLAVQGWFWWAFAFLTVYTLVFGGSIVLKYGLMEYISKLSPAKIQRLEGDIQGFILDEIVKSLKQGHDFMVEFMVEKDVEIRSDNTPLVTIMITCDRAPQSKIALICDEDSIAITEVHYDEKVEHCKIALSLPDCTEEIERRVVQLIAKRQQEATEGIV